MPEREEARRWTLHEIERGAMAVWPASTTQAKAARRSGQPVAEVREDRVCEADVKTVALMLAIKDASDEPPCALCGTTLEMQSGDCAMCAAREVLAAVFSDPGVEKQ